MLLKVGGQGTLLRTCCYAVLSHSHPHPAQASKQRRAEPELYPSSSSSSSHPPIPNQSPETTEKYLFSCGQASRNQAGGFNFSKVTFGGYGVTGLSSARHLPSQAENRCLGISCKNWDIYKITGIILLYVHSKVMQM